MNGKVMPCHNDFLSGRHIAFINVISLLGGIVSFQKIVRSIFRPLVLSLVLTSLLVSFGAMRAAGQEGLNRRIKSKVNPVYPDIARKLGLVGAVRLEITVATNGTVKDTKVIGGNPILVNAAIDAVKRWKFESGNDESVGVVEFKFDPTN
jgi:TonB family protein